MTIEEKEKLFQYREWLLVGTEEFIERSKMSNVSTQGSHYDRGNANGLILARAKLEELFDYWNEL